MQNVSLVLPRFNSYLIPFGSISTSFRNHWTMHGETERVLASGSLMNLMLSSVLIFSMTSTYIGLCLYPCALCYWELRKSKGLLSS